MLRYKWFSHWAEFGSFSFRYSLRSRSTPSGQSHLTPNPMPNGMVLLASSSFFLYNSFDHNPGMSYGNCLLSGYLRNLFVCILGMFCVFGIFSCCIKDSAMHFWPNWTILEAWGCRGSVVKQNSELVGYEEVSGPSGVIERWVEGMLRNPFWASWGFVDWKGMDGTAIDHERSQIECAMGFCTLDESERASFMFEFFSYWPW